MNPGMFFSKPGLYEGFQVRWGGGGGGGGGGIKGPNQHACAGSKCSVLCEVTLSAKIPFSSTISNNTICPPQQRIPLHSKRYVCINYHCR